MRGVTQVDTRSWRLMFGPRSSVASSKSARRGMEWRKLPAVNELRWTTNKAKD